VPEFRPRIGAGVRQRILAGTAFASYNDTVSHLTDEGMT
jgi:hypothetical protein